MIKKRPNSGVPTLLVPSGGGVPVGGGSWRVNDTLLSPRVFDPYQAFPLRWDDLQSHSAGFLCLKAATPDLPMPAPLHLGSDEELMGN